MPVDQSMYIRRCGKVALPPPTSVRLPVAYATSLSANIESLGYALSPDLAEACLSLSRDELTLLEKELVHALGGAVGAHAKYSPMYPNFPRQVMETADAELYFNAIVHYWSKGKLFPATRKKLRKLLPAPPMLKMLELGTQDEFERIFPQIASANASPSEQDREDMAWFVSAFGDDVFRLVPETIPQKETLAVVTALLIEGTGGGEAFLEERIRTATDVLRVAVALSGGDVSLAEATRFRSFRRRERRMLLAVVNAKSNALEDMLRWKERWKRLAERLHPGEFATEYPNAAKAFQVLRNDTPSATLNGRVEGALRRQDIPGALGPLRSRPGDFVRRLDHLLRLDPSHRQDVLDSLEVVACNVSTPVLLQARHHFLHRNEPRDVRAVFPKGHLAKAFALPPELPPLDDETCARTAARLEEALLARFAERPPLGNVFVDEALRDVMVPFGMRSASKALRTVPRGSRLDLPECDTLRFFIWWKNGKKRTDIDLSAAMFGDDFLFLDYLTYYNLKGLGGCHSGDIVDAPDGASEFIDVSLTAMRQLDVRYVVMLATSYTGQPYVDLPECFAGWMARSEPESGEIYEPRTVVDRFDLSANTRVAIPLVFDIVERRAIWCDLALKSQPNWINNLHTQFKGVVLSLATMTNLNKPNLHDLLTLHAKARGTLVPDEASANTVFSIEAGTPFQIETIASEYMA